MKQGKKWGETLEVFKSEFIKVHYISIKKDGYSSKHKHKIRINHFFVISGELIIYQWTKEGFIDETKLITGESTFIPEGVEHRFHAKTDVRCIEVYSPSEISDVDIDRDGVGGMGDLGKITE